MKVAVFGGALPISGDPVYEMAYDLGAALAKAGHRVINGGYIGTMEAVSKGAYEEGGVVVGVTCDEIEKWRKIEPNDYITEEVRCATLKERLAVIIDQCEAAVVLPGGLGTLAEAALLWNEIAIEAKPKVPMVFMGIGWEEVFESLFANMGEFIRAEDRALLHFVMTVPEVIPLLTR